MTEVPSELIAMGVGRYRHRPTVVLAAEVLDSNVDMLAAWCGGHVNRVNPDRPVLLVPTPEGARPAVVGDWLVQGVLAEFYPIKAEAFRAGYVGEHNGHQPPPLSGQVEPWLTWLAKVREHAVATHAGPESPVLVARPGPSPLSMYLTELDSLIDLLRALR